MTTPTLLYDIVVWVLQLIGVWWKEEGTDILGSLPHIVPLIIIERASLFGVNKVDTSLIIGGSRCPSLLRASCGTKDAITNSVNTAAATVSRFRCLGLQMFTTAHEAAQYSVFSITDRTES